jgi:hypothetical protein
MNFSQIIQQQPTSIKQPITQNNQTEQTEQIEQQQNNQTLQDIITIIQEHKLLKNQINKKTLKQLQITDHKIKTAGGIKNILKNF